MKTTISILAMVGGIEKKNNKTNILISAKQKIKQKLARSTRLKHKTIIFK